jgi:hypothetical protein
LFVRSTKDGMIGLNPRVRVDQTVSGLKAHIP